MSRWLAALVAMLVSWLAAMQSLHFWNRDLADPYCYDGDAIIMLAWIKGVTENPWTLTNQYLGAPGVQEMHDFPHTSNVHFLAIKLLAQINPDPFWLANVYFILTFPLVTLSFYLLTRSLSIQPWIGTAIAVLFAFLPGHFLRQIAHLFLSSYWLLPLGIIPLVWLNQGTSYLVERNETGRLRVLWFRRKTIFTVIIAALCGSDFPYYAVFSVLTILIGATFLALQRKHLMASGGCQPPVSSDAASNEDTDVRNRGLTPTARQTSVGLSAFLLVSLFATALLANLAPTFLYKWQHGENPSQDHVSVHDWSQGEHYGLKITSMMMPIREHPVGFLRSITREYYDKTPVQSEAQLMAIGFVGSVGLVAALLLLFRPNLSEDRQRFHYLIGITIVALILFGTISGFGTFANLLHIRSVRSYNRVSMTIAVLAFLTVAMLLDQLRPWLASRSRWWRWSFAMGVLGMVPCGLIDQAWHKGKVRVAEQDRYAAWKRADAEYFAQLQQMLPRGAMVFELPQISLFSKTEGRSTMLHYDHLRPYLHTNGIRWSYGAMHGRPTDDLHIFLGRQPTPKFVRLLASLEFEGIHVDRKGYADGGKAIVDELQAMLGQAKVNDVNGRYLYFSLTDYRRQLIEQYGDDSLKSYRDYADAAPMIVWSRKTAGDELRRPDGSTSRFVFGKFEAHIYNPAFTPRIYDLHFAIEAQAPRVSVLLMSHPGGVQRIKLSESSNEYRERITLPPGETTITFQVAGDPDHNSIPGGHLSMVGFRLELPENRPENRASVKKIFPNAEPEKNGSDR